MAEIRPKLAKTREIAEKAESENRALTAEEQKTYDEIMAKGRSVADAVKQHRHDQEVFAFAQDLSDNVIGGLDGGDLSSSGWGSKSRRLSFKDMGGAAAAKIRAAGPDGMKTPAASGTVVTDQFAYLRQSVRTNTAAIVAEGATKPTSRYTVTQASRLNSQCEAKRVD